MTQKSSHRARFDAGRITKGTAACQTEEIKTATQTPIVIRRNTRLGQHHRGVVDEDTGALLALPELVGLGFYALPEG